MLGGEIPAEDLLAELREGVDVALFGVGLEGRLFVDDRATGKARHAVYAERAHQYDTGRRVRSNRFQQVLP